MLTSVNKLLLLVSPFKKFFKNVLLRNFSKTFKKSKSFYYWRKRQLFMSNVALVGSFV